MAISCNTHLNLLTENLKINYRKWLKHQAIMKSMHGRNDQMSNLKIWFDRLWPYFLQELPKICNPAQMFCLSIAKSKSHYFDLQNLRYELRTQFLAIYRRLKLCAHYLYRILDSKKTSCFQFSVPGLREIHRNLEQQKNFNSRDGFFRKSPFCTFSCINPGFGRPWGML